MNDKKQPTKWIVTWMDFRHGYPEMRQMTVKRKTLESALKYAFKKHPKMRAPSAKLV